MKLNRTQITWLIILAVIVAALTALYFIGNSLGWFALFESKEKVREYVSSFGGLAPLVFFILQFVQVVISPIPGNFTTMAGGLLFGPLKAFLISTGAVFLGSVSAFMLGKLFGRPLVERIAGKNVVDKYMATVSSRQKIVLILMFMFPFFPDDVLCLIAGLSAMSLPFFSLLVILTRPWGLLFSALLGSGIIHIPIWGWIIITAVVAALFIISLKYAPVIEERIKSWLERTFVRIKGKD